MFRKKCCKMLYNIRYSLYRDDNSDVDDDFMVVTTFCWWLKMVTLNVSDTAIIFVSLRFWCLTVLFKISCQYLKLVTNINCLQHRSSTLMKPVAMVALKSIFSDVFPIELSKFFNSKIFNSHCNILCIVVLPHFGNLLWNIKSGLGKTGAPLSIRSKSTEYQIKKSTKNIISENRDHFSTKKW